MNTLLHNDRDDEDDTRGRSFGRSSQSSGHSGKDRETTLGTTMVLGIFFALAVFGAIFFGFGYSLGSKRTAVTATASSEGNSSVPFNSFKPAPGSPVGAAAVKPSAGESVAVPYTPPAPVTTRVVPTPKPNPDGEIVEDAPVRPAIKPPAPAAAAPLAATAGVGSAMVQVAAVSHQEDADLLVSTLKRRGYNVGIHSETQDKLLHVQIGPFPSRKDADAMRQRLLADGFNAIVK